MTCWWMSSSILCAAPDDAATHACNICQWSGDAFIGSFHSESAQCPQCGSISRDRFLVHSFVSRTPGCAGRRVLETSPRLGQGYRTMMRRDFDYSASDFDLTAHVGDLRIDLQDIALPDESIDIVLTPHVLEHVPDTDRALAEIFRVLSPGGRMYLQVPLLHGVTREPLVPEFHADNTKVFFNFGWDLLDRLRAARFTTSALVTDEWLAALTGLTPPPPDSGDEFSIGELVDVARRTLVGDRDVVSVADRQTSLRLGFLPPHHHVTWECVKPSRSDPR